MTEEAKRDKIKHKPSFTFKLPKPKIVFGSVSPTIQEHSHNISAPTDFKRDASIGIDKDTGKFDLSLVPPEFEELRKVYEEILQQKIIQTDKVVEDSQKAPDEEVVLKRKGPTVQKGLKDEDILKEMRSLVTPGDPWDIYESVRIVQDLALTILTFADFAWGSGGLESSYNRYP